MKLFKTLKNQKGFTLIELLVVIGILAILLAITLIAINPAKQFAQANDTKRRSDVNELLNAVNQYMASNKGTIPAGITTTAQNISKTGADICMDLVTTGEYIAALPTDPKTGIGAADVLGASVTDCAQATYDTKYTIVKTASGRITVAAPDKEGNSVISVTR